MYNLKKYLIMRSKFFLAVMLIVLGCSFFACEEHSVQSVEESIYSSLNADLDSFTTDFNKKNGVVVTKGKFWKKLWGHIKNTISADAKGALSGYKQKRDKKSALIGAVIGSAEYIIESLLETESVQKESYIIYDDAQKKVVEHKEEIKVKDFVKKEPITSSNIGKLHNMCLEEMKDDISGLRKRVVEEKPITRSSEQKAEENLALDLADIVAEKIGVAVSEEQRKEISDDIALVNKFIANGNKEEEQEFFREAGLENHYLILQKYIDNMANFRGDEINKEQLLKYTEGYLNIIKDARIPQQDIEVMSSAIMVAVNSSVYWDTKTE